MANYNIDYSDPIKTASAGFSISDGTYNGPGSPNANTSLRLFGQGAPMWGEAVDENFVRLLEHFAGATPPPNPTTGQLWLSQKLYWRNTTTGADIGWYVFDFATSTPSTVVWKPIPASADLEAGKMLSGNTPPPDSSAPVGSYYFNTATNQLFMWASQYNQSAPRWIERIYGSNDLGLTNSTPGFHPPCDLLMYNEQSAGWSPIVQPAQSAVIVSPTAPVNPKTGLMWLNTLTGAYPAGLYIRTDTLWAPIAYLNLTNEGRISVASTPSPLNAVATFRNKLVTGQGDNNTHFGYTASDGLTVQNFIRGHYLYIDTPTITLNGRTVAKDFVTAHADPIQPMHVATKQYVDSHSGGATSGSLPPGSIIMWAPSAGPIPAGWVMCDGSNGTPNLRNRFIVGAGDSYASGTTGGGSTTSNAGAHVHTTSTAGGHSHGGATAGYALQTSEIPAHTHTWKNPINEGEYWGETARGNGNSEYNGVYKGWYGSKYSNTSSVGSGAPHSHAIGSDGNHSHSTSQDGDHAHQQSLPPYYALIFIMKTGGSIGPVPTLTISQTTASLTVNPGTKIVRTKLANISGESWTLVSNTASDPVLASVVVDTDAATNEVYVVTTTDGTTPTQPGTYTRTVVWRGQSTGTEVQMALTVIVNNPVITQPLTLSVTSYSRSKNAGQAASADAVSAYANELPILVSSGLPAGMSYTISGGSIILTGTYPSASHSGSTTFRGSVTGTVVTLSHTFTISEKFVIPNQTFSDVFEIPSNIVLPNQYSPTIGSFSGGPIASVALLPGGTGPWLSPTVTWTQGAVGTITLYFNIMSYDVPTTYTGTLRFTTTNGQVADIAYTISTFNAVAPPPPPPPPAPPSAQLSFDLTARETTGVVYATNPSSLGDGYFDVAGTTINAVNMQIGSFDAGTGLGTGINRYLQVDNIIGQDAGSSISYSWVITSTDPNTPSLFELGAPTGNTNRVMTSGSSISYQGAYRSATVTVTATTSTGQTFSRTTTLHVTLDNSGGSGGSGGVKNPPNTTHPLP